MIEQVIRDLESSFEIRRLNQISSTEEGNDIDFFIYQKDVHNIVNFLANKGFIFRSLPGRGIVAYKFFNGTLYDLDLAYSCESLLVFFPRIHFKPSFYEAIWRDPDLEKFMRYVLQFRKRKKKYSKFVKENFEKYGQYLSDTTYLDSPIFKNSITADQILQAMNRRWFVYLKILPLKLLIPLFFLIIKRKLQRLNKGRLIAFIGADGAGKSTAIKKIKRITTSQSKVFGDGSIWLHQIYNKTDKLHIAIARLKYIGIFFEQWGRYIYFWFLKLQGQTILLDRWPGMNRQLQKNHFWQKINNIIYFFFPEPDLYIFLSAFPESIHIRKPELSIEEINNYQENTRKILTKKRHFEIITENHDDSLTRILKIVLSEQGEPLIEISPIKDITILIKTFERPKSLFRLLSSIYKFYPNIPLVIADDSKDAEKNKACVLKLWPDTNINYLVLPFDSGLSFGRNEGLKNIKTKYFVLCDDDFIFDEKTNLEHLQLTLTKKKLDLVAGTLLETPDLSFPLLNFISRKIYTYFIDKGWLVSLPVNKILCGVFFKPNPEVLELRACSDTQGDVIKSDIGFNFFIAKTEIKNKVVWRNELKLLEHLPFFYDFKQAGLTMMVDTTVSVNHVRDMGLYYRNYRYRKENDLYKKTRLNMLGIKKYTSIDPIIKN